MKLNEAPLPKKMQMRLQGVKIMARKKDFPIKNVIDKIKAKKSEFSIHTGIVEKDIDNEDIYFKANERNHPNELVDAIVGMESARNTGNDKESAQPVQMIRELSTKDAVMMAEK